MIRGIITFLWCSIFACYPATWYAASNGSGTNGTSSIPWSPLFAVTNTNPYLATGDIVLFKSGTYVCEETNIASGIGQILEFRFSGTESQKITYKSESLWGFSVDGGLLLKSASNVVVSGFRIFYSGNTNRNRTNELTYPPGITEYTTGNRLEHNLLENTGHPGIGSWSGTKGKNIAGNILRFTGVNDWTGSYEGNSRGSALYLQNEAESSEALIMGNISYFNYSTGMKAYGEAGDVWGFRFLHNICVDNNEAGIFYSFGRGSDGVQIFTNYMWDSYPSIRIGYQSGDGGHSNAAVVGNYVVDYGGDFNGGPLYMVDGWRNTVWTNNTAVDIGHATVWYLEVPGETSGDVTSHTIDYNTYYGSGTHSEFEVNQVGKTLAEWQATVLGDTNSTYTSGAPTGVVSYVFHPSTDNSFIHVAVFNWPTNATIDVDLSAFYSVGDMLAIYDAQNIPTAYTNLTYSSGSVTLDLSLTNRVEMLGEFTQRSDTWEGFDPRFRAFVIHRTGNAGAINVGTLRAQNLILR